LDCRVGAGWVAANGISETRSTTKPMEIRAMVVKN
jgi:hypothetical protein